MKHRFVDGSVIDITNIVYIDKFSHDLGYQYKNFYFEITLNNNYKIIKTLSLYINYNLGFMIYKSYNLKEEKIEKIPDDIRDCSFVKNFYKNYLELIEKFMENSSEKA